MNLTVLLVDDEPNVTSALARQLQRYRSDWRVLCASSAKTAWQALHHTEVDVMVLDVAMPEQTGFDFLRELGAVNLLEIIPVVMLTGMCDENLKRQALDLGAADLMQKPVETADLVARIGNMLRLKQATQRLKAHQAELEELVAERTASLESTKLSLAVRLAKIAEMRDECTGDHVLRVGRYSAEIAGRLGWSTGAARRVLLAAPMHDIGKIAIPDAILLKRGALNPVETVVMRTHCELGAKMLLEEPKLLHYIGECADRLACGNGGDDDVLAMAAQIAHCHHERWDGKGYPRGLKGRGIPREARVVAVADAFDALTTNRPYRAPMPADRALEILIVDRGSHFDGDVMDAFVACFARIVGIRASLQSRLGLPLEEAA